ncbi:MAG: methyltransferase domain-containing protein [Candidatus Dadabacteria bacterium]|nr:MAG: methyltransferase domain-containing protein [Candidatus Dadabacteria bacterium]
MSTNGVIHEGIREYYGSVLKSNKDLKSNACCTAEKLPAHLKEILNDIHPEIIDKFYGCGSPIPECLEGLTVLDLGCGSGRDCFMLSKLVGPNGRVIGIDMTEEQLSVARSHIEYHRKKFGYQHSNIEFKKGYIENLREAGIEDESVDLVVSNCVINLSPYKDRVFREIFRVLKPGGELYFSDVFAARRIPEELKQDKVLMGECIAGAMYTEDFRRLLHSVGIRDYRIVSETPLEINSADLKRKVEAINFYSMTVRAFKLSGLEDRCENYGQVAYYRGTIPEAPTIFVLDNHHVFENGLAFPVCGNTALMLSRTRYAKHFNVVGDTSVHYGLFPCKESNTVYQNGDSSKSGACC